MHLYVYYDVPEEAVATVRQRVAAMQADLRAQTRVTHPRLMRRVDGDTTWMEVYEDVTPSFEGALAGAAERHGVATATGPRHVERFTDVDGADLDGADVHFAEISGADAVRAAVGRGGVASEPAD